MHEKGKWSWLYFAVILTFLLPLAPADGRMFGSPPPNKAPAQPLLGAAAVAEHNKSAANSSSAASKKKGPDFREGEVIVKYKKSVTRGQALQISAAHSLAAVKEFKALSEAKGNVYLVLKSQTASTRQLMEKLKKDASVEQVSPNYARKATQTPNDPLFDQLWGLNNTGQSVGGYYSGVAGADIHAAQAWDITTGSSSVVVADIDSGVAYNHSDLKDNIWVNPFETAANGNDDDGNGYVDDIHGINAIDLSSDPMDNLGHGTHTAGTIAAAGNNGKGVVGVAWNAKVMPLKFINYDGYGYDSDAIECINYVISMKQRGVNVVAINASWGGYGYNAILKDAIAAAGEAGILFVAAAGNEYNNNDAYPAYPASYDLPNIIAVAATTSSDYLSGWSNYGASKVHLAAPGDEILSTVPGGVPVGTPIFFDDMENGATKWVHGGRGDTWGLTTEKAVSGSHSWSDSPNGNYGNGVNNYLALANPVDLSGVQGHVGLRFNALTNMEYWYDQLSVEVSKDGGATWTTLGMLYYYTWDTWYSWLFQIPDEFKTNKFKVRFRLKTDDSSTSDGVYIDDVAITKIEENAYAYYSGTSMATPHVTGAVALLASQYPNDSINRLKNRILTGVDQLSQLNGVVSTSGRLNIATALDPNLILKPTVFTVDATQTIYGPRPVVNVTGDSFGSSTGVINFADLNGNNVSATIVSWSDNKIVFVIPQNCSTQFIINLPDGRYSGPYTFNLWQPKAQLWQPTDNFATAVSGDKMYIFGGYISGGTDSTSYAEMYDPSTNSWWGLPSSNIDRANHTAAELNGKIYLIGGYSSNTGQRFSTVEQYDPINYSYTTMNPYPEAVSWARSANLNGTLYVTGGYNGSMSASLYRYEPSTDSWTALAAMSTARAGHGMVALNGKLYIFGGADSSTVPTTSVEVYDPAGNTWSSLAAMPVALFNTSATTDGRFIYVMNGSSTSFWSDPNDTMLRYDPATNTWATLPLHTVASKLGAGVAYINKRIYNLGGYGFDSYGYMISMGQVESLAIDYRLPVTSISPAPGTYNTAQTVTLSVDETNSTIYYTTDGSTPTTGSLVFAPNSSITVATTKTIKFFAVDPAGNAEAVHSATYTISNAAPTLGTVTPASGTFGTGSPITFTATYTDVNGGTDISVAKMLINTSTSAPNPCAVMYKKSDGKFYLLVNGSYSTGTGSISNNQCTLDLTGSSASVSGNTLTTVIKVTPKDLFAGTRNVYLQAQDVAGLTAGWTSTPQGSVTFNGAPVVGTVSPATGTFNTGSPIAFTATYTDPNGGTDVSIAKMLINTSTSSPNPCAVMYKKSDGKFYLLVNGSYSTGTGSISNSQCTLDLTGSSASVSGNTLTTVIKVTPKDLFAGTQNVYLQAQDVAGLTGGWTTTPQATVTFAVNTNSPPALGTVTPASGTYSTGSPITFTASYSDPNGGTDISQAKILINTSTATANPCAVMYKKSDGKFYLLVNGSYSTGTGSISSDQCSLDLTGSSASVSGNTLTTILKITPKDALAGPRNVYLQAQDVAGLTTGWTSTPQGSLTFNAAPSLGTVSPASGTFNTGSPLTVTATYSDPNGATDISLAKLLIGSSTSATSACAVMYQKSDGKFYLLNDAGSTWSTGTASVSNTQCTLDITGSSISTSGNTLTVNFKVTPKSGYAGPKNLYLKAHDVLGRYVEFASKGTVTFVAPNSAPTFVSVTPGSSTIGTGSPFTLTATFSDPNGASDIDAAEVLISSGGASGHANAFDVSYSKTTGKIYLADNAGTSWSTGTGAISNSQGTLDLAGSSVSLNGNTLTLTLKITPAASFTGVKGVYPYAKDVAGVETSSLLHPADYNFQNPGTVQGQVKDAASGNPLSGVSVTASLGGNTIASTTTATDGTFSFSVPAGTGYSFSFNLSGYISNNIGNFTVTGNTNNYLPVVLQIDNGHSGNGNVSGKVYDAVTGAVIPGATVNLRAGISVYSGTIVATTTTASDGSYSITNLAAGNYTAEVSITGYATAYASVLSLGGTTTANQNATLTPTVPTGQTRIVLTWGSSPYDLDSHLTGPDGSGNRFHVYYSASSFTGTGSAANLDVDDTSSYGPETTTITTQAVGTYRFSVHDFSNLSSTTSTALSNSGATVTVYHGSNITTFNVPPSTGGTLWTVFELNGDTITPINSMTYYSDPYTITSIKKGSHSDADLIFSNLTPKK